MLQNQVVTVLGHIIRLPEENIVREIPVFGELNGLFVRGVVDEIQLNGGVLEVHENKTRRKPTVPSEPQLRCNRFQIMIYWRLLKDMRNGKFGYSEISDFYQLDPDNVTDEFKSELEEKVSVNLPTYELERIGELVFDGFIKLPQISERLTIRYIHQGTNREIGEKKFDFNSSGFEDNIDFVSKYWTGERDAIPVGKKNEWKCNYCDYSSECPKYNRS